MPQIMIYFHRDVVQLLNPAYDRPKMSKRKKKLRKHLRRELLKGIGEMATLVLVNSTGIKFSQIVFDTKKFGAVNSRTELIEVQVLYGMNHEAGTYWKKQQRHNLAKKVTAEIAAFAAMLLDTKIPAGVIGTWVLPVGSDEYITNTDLL